LGPLLPAPLALPACAVARLPTPLCRAVQVSGLLMDKELSSLGKITSNPEHPVVACIGGSKVRQTTHPPTHPLRAHHDDSISLYMSLLV
jgi:hypothetical protein